MRIDFSAPTVPLGYDAPLNQVAEFPLLGVPLRIESNSATVIAAAHTSFCGWRRLSNNEIAPIPPRMLRVVVQASDTLPSPSTALIQRAHSGSFLAMGAGCMLTANYVAGHALAVVTPSFAADELALRYQVLECLALLLVYNQDRLPIQAGAITRGNHTILLLGASNSGKSTLSYAALRCGFSLLAEEGVALSSNDGLRFWGNPWRLHLPADAPRFFPELAHSAPQRHPNGKWRIILDSTEHFPDQLRLSANEATLCILDHHARMDSRLEPIAPAEILQQLTQRTGSLYDLWPLPAPVAQTLAAQGGYRLTMGRDLAGAVELLGIMVA